MRIDWAQTIIGTSRAAARVPESDGHPCPLRARMTRLAGFLVAGLFIGLAIATLPSRGGAATLVDILALSGVLLGHAAGLFALSRAFHHKLMLAAGLPFLAILFAAFAGVEAPVIVALGSLVALDAFLVLVHYSSRVLALCALALAALISAACLVLAVPGFAVLALLAAGIAPIAANLVLEHQASCAAPNGSADQRDSNALLALTLRRSHCRVLLVDGAGSIARAGAGDFAAMLEAAEFPEHSLAAATLIADRVALLDAISRAIHHGESVDDLTIRLRRDPVGAGYPAPPRFDPVSCSVHPMPGRAGQAVVLLALSAGDAAAPARAIPPAVAHSQHPLEQHPLEQHALPQQELARALHDCAAPFNAGLGFLEMIADPRLAPRDIATYRDFAAEAHKAISMAHRNSLLLGRLVKVLDAREACRVEHGDIMPRRLIGDAIRAMNLRDAEDRGEIRVLEPDDLPMVHVPTSLARFAVEVLLREAQHAGGARLSVTRAADDLVIACAGVAHAGEPVERDAFQHLVEAAISSASEGITFEAGAADVRVLRFSGAFAGGQSAGNRAATRPYDGSATVSGTASIRTRLAS